MSSDYAPNTDETNNETPVHFNETSNPSNKEESASEPKKAIASIDGLNYALSSPDAGTLENLNFFIRTVTQKLEGIKIVTNPDSLESMRDISKEQADKEQKAYADVFSEVPDFVEKTVKEQRNAAHAVVKYPDLVSQESAQEIQELIFSLENLKNALDSNHNNAEHVVVNSEDLQNIGQGTRHIIRASILLERDGNDEDSERVKQIARRFATLDSHNWVPETSYLNNNLEL